MWGWGRGRDCVGVCRCVYWLRDLWVGLRRAVHNMVAFGGVTGLKKII